MVPLALKVLPSEKLDLMKSFMVRCTWRYVAGGRGWGKGQCIQSRDSGKAEWSFSDSSMQGNGLRGTAQGGVTTL